MTTQKSVRLRAHLFLLQKKKKNRADFMWQSLGTVTSCEAFRRWPSRLTMSTGTEHKTSEPSKTHSNALLGKGISAFYFGNFALSSHYVVILTYTGYIQLHGRAQCGPLCKDPELMGRGFRADILSTETPHCDPGCHQWGTCVWELSYVKSTTVLYDPKKCSWIENFSRI